MPVNNKNPKVFASLSDFENEPVEFLWDPYIIKGEVNILEGDPGIGKSYLAMQIAAQVSVGGTLPGQQQVSRGRVIYMSQEDAPGHTIRPRIEMMGGDPKKIKVVANPIAFDEKGFEALEQEMELRPASLIVADPLFGFVGAGSDPYKPQEIRATLGRLQRLASEYNSAILIIRHLTKGGKEKAIYRGNGSIDVIAFARSALAVGLDPQDAEVRVMAHLKHNIAAKGPSWAYELVPGAAGTVPAFRWTGTSDLSAHDLQGPLQDHAGQLANAEKALRELLADGSKSQTTIVAQTEAKGISSRTLDRAKKQLEVKSTKAGKTWMWSMP